jgi:hypothetical protein
LPLRVGVVSLLARIDLEFVSRRSHSGNEH